MILVDTSAWVEFDRASGSPAHLRVRELIEDGARGAVTEPVMAEVLVGARDERREEELRRLLLSFELLAFESVTDFDAAVRVYRHCRHSGVTPRGIVDCMIAAVAWRRRATLLAHDADLARMAPLLGIELDEASLRTGGP